MPKWLLVLGASGLALSLMVIGFGQFKKPVKPMEAASKLPITLPATPIPSPSPSPTPRPLTFAEMNEKYGPCISLPVLMYHHIQTEEQARAKNQTGLTVYTSTFKEQMQYLKDKGYTTITPGDLKNFFRDGTKPPAKAVMLTIDDGYADNFTDAFPILKEMGFTATVFIATGLMDNPDYLTWSQVAEMKNGGIYFGNHTWSHKNMQSNAATIEKEVGTAETQLAERGLNPDKIFAFPYGTMSGTADAYLAKEGYSLAFDTQPGRIQCAKQKYSLPRIRIGNTKLSGYGL